ncbi:MAG TPA: hypothetical protein VNO31_49135 [Umezawaea sp.]|nr:hypothetical protein [Umezawaea sp.]
MRLPEPGVRVRTAGGVGGVVQRYQADLPAACSVPARLDTGVTRMLGPNDFTPVAVSVSAA